MSENQNETFTSALPDIRKWLNEPPVYRPVAYVPWQLWDRAEEGDARARQAVNYLADYYGVTRPFPEGAQ